MPLRDHLDEIRILIKSGLTYSEIARSFGVSRERVRQIAGNARQRLCAKCQKRFVLRTTNQYCFACRQHYYQCPGCLKYFWRYKKHYCNECRCVSTHCRWCSKKFEYYPYTAMNPSRLTKTRIRYFCSNKCRNDFGSYLWTKWHKIHRSSFTKTFHSMYLSELEKLHK